MFLERWLSVLRKSKVPMNTLKLRLLSATIASLLLTFSSALTARASLVRTQTIALHKGWNAVYLAVTPSPADPSTVFANTPVSIAAIFLPRDTPVEYIQNPGTISWKKDGWSVWYAPNRPDTFLSNLHSLAGNQAYLLFAQTACTLQVIGTVSLQSVQWRANSFNFVGFPLDDQSPPTFDQFFNGSTAHQPYRIYHLVNDQWMQISGATLTTMQPGEAFWIYCNGSSSYQGPLSAQVPSSQAITFANNADSYITLANQSPNPMTVRLDTVATDAGLPLTIMLRGVTPTNMTEMVFDLPSSIPIASLEPGAATTVRFGLHRANMTSPTQTTLLKLTTDTGAQVWIPVTGTRGDLSASP